MKINKLISCIVKLYISVGVTIFLPIFNQKLVEYNTSKRNDFHIIAKQKHISHVKN